MLELLRYRAFALLWIAGLVSVAGDWTLRAALPFYVYAQTGSTLATAGMVVASLLPGALASSLVGVFVDRYTRRRILIVANAAQAASVLALLAVAAADGRLLWLVYVVAAVQALIATFSVTAEAALLPTLVPGDRLVAANALNALNNRLGRLVGATAGGTVLASAGLGAVVVLDCLSFVLAGVLVASMGRAEPVRPVSRVQIGVATTSRWRMFWREWGEGLRAVREPSIAMLFVVLGLGTFAGTMLDPLTVAWVRDVLGEGPEVFAALIAVHAALGIVSTLLVGSFGDRLRLSALIGLTTLTAAAVTAIKVNVPVLPVAVTTTAVQGVTSVAAAVGLETVAMQTVREELRGRVFGSLNATLMLLSLTGALTAGTCGELFGIVPTLNLAVVLIALSGLVALRAFREPV